MNKIIYSVVGEKQLIHWQKGRMVKEEEVVNDVVGVGLQNLTAGEKNPLNEYNAATGVLDEGRLWSEVESSAICQNSFRVFRFLTVATVSGPGQKPGKEIL